MPVTRRRIAALSLLGLTSWLLTLLALAQSLSDPQKDPATFDIVGVHLGMSPQQVTSALKAADSAMRITPITAASRIDD